MSENNAILKQFKNPEEVKIINGMISAHLRGKNIVINNSIYLATVVSVTLENTYDCSNIEEKIEKILIDHCIETIESARKVLKSDYNIEITMNTGVEQIIDSFYLACRIMESDVYLNPKGLSISDLIECL